MLRPEKKDGLDLLYPKRMNPLRVSIVIAFMIGLSLAAGSAKAQQTAGLTGYAAKKPVFGGFGPTCP